MKYFDIDETQRYHSWTELKQQEGFSGKLNGTEIFMVLEEQLRPQGLQPYLYMDYSGFEIQPASKKFLQKSGQHSRSISNRALQYMAFCDSVAIAESPGVLQPTTVEDLASSAVTRAEERNARQIPASSLATKDQTL